MASKILLFKAFEAVGVVAPEETHCGQNQTSSASGMGWERQEQFHPRSHESHRSIGFEIVAETSPRSEHGVDMTRLRSAARA